MCCLDNNDCEKQEQGDDVISRQMACRSRGLLQTNVRMAQKAQPEEVWGNGNQVL